MTSELVTVVQPNRAGALQPGHSRNQIAVGSFQHDVIMIAHEAIGMNLPPGLFARFGQRLNEVMAVHIAQENIIALIPSAHHMIHRTGKLQSKLARHGARIRSPCSSVKSRKSLSTA